MKRLLLLLLATAALVASVQGVALTFQNAGDFVSQISVGSNVPPNPSDWLVSWNQNTTGGDSSIACFSHGASVSAYFYNTPPGTPSSYAAATLYAKEPNANPYIIIYGADTSTVQFEYQVGTSASNGRYEIYVDPLDAKARIYCNGVLLTTSGVLAVNPSYVAFGTKSTSSGTLYWDDYIFGTSAQKFIFDMPQTGFFIIKKDVINPADRGFAWANNGTVLYAHGMRSYYGIPNQLNESIYLENFGDGNVVATFYPGTNQNGGIVWNLDTAIFDNPVAKYGNYVMRSSNASAILPSEYITYEGYGASCTWSASSFVPLDTGTVSWAISSGGYWNTTGYDYKLCVINPVGTFVQNTSIIAQTGSANYQFTTTDPQGIYTAVVMAIPHAGGAEIWMTADYTNLFQYVSFAGYVNGAQYAIPIPAGAHYNLTQGAIIQQGDTLADGSYNATGFLTGSNVTINVTAANHRQYYVEIQPLNPRRVELNITLVPINVSEIGSSIGGVLRTGSLNGTIVSKGFGEPITFATVTASNATEVYTNISNNAAWYLFDNTNAALVSGRLYTINATKAGYGTQSYQVVAP